jgi:transaldolase/glucose-6-phosphate isomerase
VALPLPAQRLFPGILDGAYQRELRNLTAADTLARLWAKDASLWPVEKYRAESVKDNLRWLDLPEQLAPLLARVVSRAAQIEPAGFEDVVFVTMGESNLAAESVLCLPDAKLGKRTFLLNSIDPDSIRAFENTLRLDRTLFIFANKSGKHIETHSLLLYFLERLKVRGVDSPASHIITLTEENSYPVTLSRAYEFLDTFLDPPGIQGRYSSLIHFNFFLAALCHMDMDDLLALSQSMRDACSPVAQRDANPAVTLGAFLAAAELEGLNRLLFCCAEHSKPVSRRIGHLVGASTCKHGRGLVPIVGRVGGSSKLPHKGFAAVIFKIAGDQDQQLNERQQQLRAAGTPFVAVELNGPEELAAEIFKWEIATALCCSLLKVDPFHDPDIRESKARSAQALERITAKHQSSPPTVRVREGEIELYADGQTRQAISSLNMTEALRTFFNLRHATGYISLLPFMSPEEPQKIIFRRICERLESAFALPVLITPGPRYLHSIGQVYKGGPSKGLFLVLTVAPVNDLAIPGADYSFGQLQLALALGDFESLGCRRRPVIRLHLTRGADSGLAQFESILDNMLGRRHILTS